MEPVAKVQEKKPLTFLEWTDTLEIIMMEAMLNNGKILIPVGLNKSFIRIAIHSKFEAVSGLSVEGQVLWDWIDEKFNMQKVEQVSRCPFPNETTEFSLPDDEFFRRMMAERMQNEVATKDIALLEVSSGEAESDSEFEAGLSSLQPPVTEEEGKSPIKKRSTPSPDICSYESVYGKMYERK